MSMRARVRLSPERHGVLVQPRGDGSEDLRDRIRTSTGRAPRRRTDGYLVPFASAPALVAIRDLEWDPDARRAVENREQLAAHYEQVAAHIQRLQEGGPQLARRILHRHDLVEQLDDHQAVNVAALTAPNGWGGCLFDEQGTGKTPTMVVVFDVLHERNEADTLLVVAPKSMMAEWSREVERFTSGLYRVGVVTGSRAERAATIEDRYDVLVVNYETVVSMLASLKLLAKRTRLVLAVDESFFVKNSETRRASAVADLREWCSHAYVLCGTPAPNSPRDLVAQFDLVDFGMTFSGVHLDTDPSRAADQVRSVLVNRGLFTRNLKSVVLPHLPSRAFSEIRVDLQPEQKRLYMSALDDLIIDLRETSDQEFARKITSFMERKTLLLRICSNPTPLAPGYSEVPVKVAALDELLSELVEGRGEKVVVWSFFRYSLDLIAERYRHLGLVRVDGSVSDVSERASAVRRFQQDEEVRIFLGNPAAAGAGLTLHAARIAVYESLSNQAAHYLQSLDRIHRRGQEREVEYITLLCRDTLEEKAYAALLAKADRQADLLGDPRESRTTRSLLLRQMLAEKERLPR